MVLTGAVFSSTRRPSAEKSSMSAVVLFPAESVATTVPWYLWSELAFQLVVVGAVIVAFQQLLVES